MPVEYRRGDLFSFEGNLAHGTNATGKMGKGIAVEFKNKFPGMFLSYEEACKAGKHTVGMILPYNDLRVESSYVPMQATLSENLPDSLKVPNVLTTRISFTLYQKMIYNICIKPHWRMKAEPYAIWAGLRAMIKHLEDASKVNQKPLAAEGISLGNNIEPIVALPQIGCGLGGLDWETQVKPIIEEIGSMTPCTLVVYLQEEPKSKHESNIDPHDADSSK